MGNRETRIIRNVYFIEPRKLYMQLISYIHDKHILYVRKILTVVSTIFFDHSSLDHVFPSYVTSHLQRTIVHGLSVKRTRSLRTIERTLYCFVH
jgi:hypothetical protein